MKIYEVTIYERNNGKVYIKAEHAEQYGYAVHFYVKGETIAIFVDCIKYKETDRVFL